MTQCMMKTEAAVKPVINSCDAHAGDELRFKIR